MHLRGRRTEKERGGRERERREKEREWEKKDFKNFAKALLEYTQKHTPQYMQGRTETVPSSNGHSK